jgi:hypothetical protein
LKPRAVKAADAIESTQQLCDVRAKDAAVGVQLIDGDDPKPFEKGSPTRVMWQDARVKHVGRRDEDLGRRFADLPSLAVRGVSVVDFDANV